MFPTIVPLRPELSLKPLTGAAKLSIEVKLGSRLR